MSLGAFKVEFLSFVQKESDVPRTDSLEGHPRTWARSSFWGGVSGGSERDGTAPSALGVCSNYVHTVIKIS